jgi:pyruvate-formate lyase-activating enzyme
MLSVVPPYTIAGPPAGMAYLLGMLHASGIDDVGFVDLRLGAPDWPAITYNSIGVNGESFVIDVPDLPLVLHLLRRLPDARVWNDFEALPWVRRYCLTRSIDPAALGASLRRTQTHLRAWAADAGSPAIAGFSTWTSNYLTTLMAAAELKRLRTAPFVVFGGPQSSESEVAAELALASGLVDAVVVGEGEQTFLELYERVDAATRMLAGAPPPGVKVWRDGAVVFGGRRKQARLEDLPPPRFDAMDLDAYSRGARQISFQLSRGCTDRCEFCSEWVFWERFRSATAESAVERLAALQRRTGFAHVTFSDSLLNGHPKRLTTFADEVLSSGLRFSWSGFARAQMDEPTARLLSRAGLHHVFVGIESFSDPTLTLMNKRRESGDNLQAIETFLAAGITVAAGIVAGFPGDSADAFRHTVDVLRSLVERHRGRFHVSIEPFIMTPTAPIFAQRGAYGMTLVPWEDEVLDLAPAFATIARRSMARVEGADQTAERAARFHAAKHVLMPAVAAASVPADESRDARGEIEVVPLGAEWVLARAIDGNERDVWLLARAELASRALDVDGSIDGRRVEALAGSTQIRRRHPLAPSTRARGIAFDLVSSVALHPSVVARRSAKTGRLIVVQQGTSAMYRFGAASATLAEHLASGLRPIDALVERHAAFGMTKKRLRRTLAEWWEKRLLVGTAAAEERRPAPRASMSQRLVVVS